MCTHSIYEIHQKVKDIFNILNFFCVVYIYGGSCMLSSPIQPEQCDLKCVLKWNNITIENIAVVVHGQF